jgi:hypothetical protein
MRKAFNFFHSYYEVAKELNDKDRLAFLDAILKKQFTGCDTELTGISKFAYLSQKHSIDSQIKGYFDKTKDPMFDPLQDPCQGGSVDPIKAPSVQEKEEEKGKEQEKEEEKINIIESFDFDGLLVFINSTFGKNFKLINDKVKKKYKALMKQGYDKKQIVKAMINAKENSYHKETNYQYCTPEFFSRTETIDKYSEIAIKQKSNNVIDNYYGL